MTTPYLRTRAIVQARDMLRALADPAISSEALERLRARATEVLRHYPYSLTCRKCMMLPRGL